jgi:hypothetical protein
MHSWTIIECAGCLSHCSPFATAWESFSKPGSSLAVSVSASALAQAGVLST